jgi:hypothetical protein
VRRFETPGVGLREHPAMYRAAPYAKRGGRFPTQAS